MIDTYCAQGRGGQVDGGLINPTDVDRMAASGCCVLLGDLSALDIPYKGAGQIRLIQKRRHPSFSLEGSHV